MASSLIIKESGELIIREGGSLYVKEVSSLINFFQSDDAWLSLFFFGLLIVGFIIIKKDGGEE